MTGSFDVAVLGAGPAGRALAHRLSRRGLAVAVLDPAADRVWSPTYAAWADELPGWLATEAIATRFRPSVWARTRRLVDREYVVLDTAGLQRSLSLDGVTVLAQRATAVDGRRITLADATSVTADLVLDARGVRPAADLAQQTAFGLVLPRRDAEPALAGPWLMDWRPAADDAAPGAPSFLYAVPLNEQDLLVEETCLAGRPALTLGELERRLRTRLARHGLTTSGDERVERVRFAVEAPPVPGLGFGARGGLMHPASGYSVAVSLREADRVVEAVLAGTDPGRALWPRPARAVQRLRRAGLRTLLSLDAAGTRDFFEAFFALPVTLQRGYLTKRRHPELTLAAMTAMAARLPARLSATAVRSTVAELRD